MNTCDPPCENCQVKRDIKAIDGRMKSIEEDVRRIVRVWEQAHGMIMMIKWLGVIGAGVGALWGALRLKG